MWHPPPPLLNNLQCFSSSHVVLQVAEKIAFWNMALRFNSTALIGTSHHRVVFGARVAFDCAAPLKHTITLNLLLALLSFNSQATRLAVINERFAFVRCYVTPARLSQHSRGAQGVVSYAEVWGRVKIYQPLVTVPRDWYQLIVNSLLKTVVHEPHAHGIVVFLLQLRCDDFKRRQLPPAGF